MIFSQKTGSIEMAIWPCINEPKKCILHTSRCDGVLDCDDCDNCGDNDNCDECNVFFLEREAEGVEAGGWRPQCNST